MAARVLLRRLHDRLPARDARRRRDRGVDGPGGPRFPGSPARRGLARSGSRRCGRTALEHRQHLPAQRDHDRGTRRGVSHRVGAGDHSGVGISYWANPIGNPAWLVAGSIVLVAAACIDAQAYRELGGSSASKKRKLGIALALVAGVLVGIFPPFVGGAISGEHALDPYVATIFFMLGASIATFVASRCSSESPSSAKPRARRDTRMARRARIGSVG